MNGAGASPTLPAFPVGTCVQVDGLSQAGYNGLLANVVSDPQVADGRIAIKLQTSGKMLGVKPENVKNVGALHGGIGGSAIDWEYS